MADTGNQLTTTRDSIETLSTTPEDTNPSPDIETPTHDWLAPPPTSEDVHHR